MHCTMSAKKNGIQGDNSKQALTGTKKPQK